MTSPIAATPPPTGEPPGEGVQLVNALWRHRGAVVGTVAALAAAVGTWYALTGRVDGVAQRQVEQAAEVSALRSAQGELRATHASDVRDMRAYVDARLDATAKAQQEADKAIAVINTRLDALDKAVGETRDNTRLLLDRLGDFGPGRRAPPERR